MITYRTGQAADELGISEYHMRRLCKSKLVKAQTTDTGRWRIQASEVERLKREGVPPIPQEEARPPAAAAGGRDPETKEIIPTRESSISHDVREALDDLAITETTVRKSKTELELEGIEDAFRARRKRSDQEEEDERRRTRQLEETETRRNWISAIRLDVAEKLPDDLPISERMQVDELIETALERYGPETGVTAKLINAAVAEGLKPYEARKRATEAVQRAVDVFRSNALIQSFTDEGKDALIKAQQIARSAVEQTPANATKEEMERQATRALSKFTEAQRRKRWTDDLLEGFRWNFRIRRQDRDRAEQAVREALGELARGSEARDFSDAAEAALEPFYARRERELEAEKAEAQQQKEDDRKALRNFLSNRELSDDDDDDDDDEEEDEEDDEEDDEEWDEDDDDEEDDDE